MNSRQRWTAGLLGLVVVLAIGAGVLWSARSSLVSWLLIRQLTAVTNRQASIERLDLDLAKGTVAITGLRVADPGAGTPFAEADHVDVRFHPGRLLRAKLAIDEIALRGVRVRVVRSERGELNVPELHLSGGGVLEVTLDRLTLADGRVTLEDHARTQVQTWRVEPIVLEVNRLLMPGQAPGSGRLTASIEGAPLSVEVTDLRLDPLHLQGRLALNNVDATLAGVFLPANVVAIIEGARLTVNASVTTDSREGTRLDAGGRLDTLTVRKRHTKDTLVSVPSLAFAVEGARIDSSGTVPSTGRITVTGGATVFDARGPAAGSVAIERLRLSIEDAEASTPGSARVAMTAAFGGSGSLDVQGPLRLAPLGAELRGRITDLDATPLLSYADLPVALAGVLDTDLTVDLASSSGKITSRVRGRATVKRAAVTGAAREIAKARQIEIDGIDAAWPRIAVSRMRVVEPAALVERDVDKRVAVAALFDKSRATPAKNAATAPPPDVAIEIGEIAVVDGAVTLDDASASPPVRLALAKLRGSARNAAWPARRPIAIDLAAATPEAGTFEANGTLSLDPAKVDVRVRVAGAALAPYQGYIPFPMRVRGFAQLDLAVAALFGATTTLTAKGTGALNNLTMSDGGDQRILWVSRIETTGVDYTFPATLAVDKLRVGRSRMKIERRADGTFPLPALFDRPEPKGGATQSAPPAAGAPAPPQISVTVRDALLEDGGARWVDAAVSPAANIELTDMRVAARDFAWPPRGPMPIEVRAVTPGGGRVGLNGALDLAAKNLEAKVTVGAVDLAPGRPYLPGRAKLDGKANADLDVKARREPLSITARGTTSLADVAFSHDDRVAFAAALMEVAGVDYAWPSTLAIDRVRVRAIRADVERARDGTFPLVTFFAGLRRPPAAAPTESSPPAGAPAPPLQLAIRESVLDGTATFTDDTVRPAARFDLTGMRLAVRDVSWPARRPAAVKFRASLPREGTVRAEGQMSLGPTSVDLDVVASGVDLASARPYVPLSGEVRGKAGATLKLNVTAQPLAVTARGTASLADLSIVKDEQPLMTAERVELTTVDYAWPATVTIDRLRVRKPWALVDRISGEVPVLAALTAPPPREARRSSEAERASEPRRSANRQRRPSPEREARRQERQAARAQSAAASPSQPPIPLVLTLTRSLFENGSATIVDRSVDPPVKVEITDARLFLREFVWPARGTSNFSARAATPNGGSLDARGQVLFDPPAIDTKVVLQRIDLASFQPLSPLKGRAAGTASADLQVKGPLRPMALSITGAMNVADVSFGDAERSLVKAKAADFTGITVQWPRQRVVIQKVRIREPWALVERDADGTLPLLALLEPRTTSPAVAPASTGASRPPASTPVEPHKDTGSRLSVGTLVVEEGFVRFTDRTTNPRFVEEASQLAVTVNKLGTSPKTRSDLSVTARLSGGAQIELQGTTGPIRGPVFADLRGKLSGFPLSRTNPYLNQLLGWVAREGSIGCTTHFRIQDDRLVAENEILVGQPLFVPSKRGDEVRERVGVPLDLLVSLLENTRHEIRLSVPVTGTLSSKQFDFGDAVWEAIRKAAINVMALPVSWVGKMFYTKDSRIAGISIWPVSFEPGTTTMRRDIDKHAERLATFMRQTPSIAFALKPVMTVEDVDALKRDAVRKRIDTLAREAGSPDAAAAKLFAERFPTRPVPTETATMIAELAKAESLPDSALQSLANARVALVRQQLESKGDVNPSRLRVSEGAVPVEASGQGRVEFEMMPDVAVAAQ